MEVRQAARIADETLAGNQASTRLWKAGRFTEAIARSLTWLARHRDSLEAALR